MVKPPSTLVMREIDEPRESHMFMRGNYMTPGDKIEPATPATLHAFEADLPRNRLGLAKWLVSRKNPLVARVTVNHWWSEIFGRGTPGDRPVSITILD